MKKICEAFWEQVNPAHACINEVVALPELGDCGFVEYFEYKAKRIIEEKKIFASFAQQNMLMLEFPEPDCAEPRVFERFFESPAVVAQNHNFEGLFAIDISNYVNGTQHLEHDRFLSLISYIKANPQTVYILFFYSDDVKEIQQVYSTILHHIDVVKTVLPEPTRQQLLDYTIEGLSELYTPLEDGILAFFQAFYNENKLGYDSADYLIRQMKLSGFQGTLEEIRKHIANIDIQSLTSGSYNGWGY